MLKKIVFGMMMAGSAMAGDWVPLWPGKAPGAEQPAAGSERVKDKRLFTDIEVPQYQLFQAENPTGQAVVILPGGGYGVVSFINEGVELGAEYAKRGITAIVVKYRVSGKSDFGYQFPVPLLDARRAIRTVRKNAEAWKVDPGKIGVIGFSAGGHLASCTVTMFDEKYEAETQDEIDVVSCRPDFGILVYPVIGMGEKWVHKGSERNLLGKNPSAEELQRVKSLDFISEKTPPIYFVHSADDGPVPLRNSMEFVARCSEKKVPVEGRVFPTGGHGFGWKGRAAAQGWSDEMFEWVLKR